MNLKIEPRSQLSVWPCAKPKILQAEQQARELQAKSIKHSAYTLGKGKENLTAFQSQRLALIAESQPALYKAYQLKEQPRIILKMPVDQVRYCLKKWYWRASHSRSQVIKDLARKIKRHQENIFNTIQNGLSNARIESINALIDWLLHGSRFQPNGFGFPRFWLPVVTHFGFFLPRTHTEIS